MDEILQNIRQVMAIIFNINLSDVPENASPDLIEKWDSVNHMSLILALEEEFEIRFSDDELPDLLNIASIFQIVSSKVSCTAAN